MIRLELTTAVAVYTFVTVVCVLLLWVFFGREKKTAQYMSEKKNIWQCAICTYTYVDSKHDVISKCPQCGSFNKRK
jgi:reverse gyrase